MADVVCEEYASSLNDLTFNSKPHISMLTMLAEENIQHATSIVKVIEAHLQKVKSEAKLPVIYLIDSIVKNIGGEYLSLFTQNLVSTFCNVFEKVDEKTRINLFKLRQTWSDVFPNKKLYGIDMRVKIMDPAWPITAQASIHVNPKFLKNSGEEEVKKTQEIQEAEMRKQLIAKQQELLRLQQQKLELELLQTKAKLEEQKRLLHQQQDKDQSPANSSPTQVEAKNEINQAAILDSKPVIPVAQHVPLPAPIKSINPPTQVHSQPSTAMAPHVLLPPVPSLPISHVIVQSLPEPVIRFPQPDLVMPNRTAVTGKDPRLSRDPRLLRDFRSMQVSQTTVNPVKYEHINLSNSEDDVHRNNEQERKPLPVSKSKDNEKLTGVLNTVDNRNKNVSNNQVDNRFEINKIEIKIPKKKIDKDKKNLKHDISKPPYVLKDKRKESNFIKKNEYKKDDKVDKHKTVEGEKKGKKSVTDAQKDLKVDEFGRSISKKEEYKKGNRRNSFRNRRNYRNNRDRSDSPEVKFEKIVKAEEKEQGKDGKKPSDVDKRNNVRGRSRSPMRSDRNVGKDDKSGEKMEKKDGDKNKRDRWKKSPRKELDKTKPENQQENESKENKPDDSEIATSDVDLRTMVTSNSKSQDVPAKEKDDKIIEEPPSKRMKREDEETSLDDLFGSKDQDYRQLPSSSNPLMHLPGGPGGWAKYKAEHPDSFRSPMRPLKESGQRDYATFGNYDQDFRKVRSPLHFGEKMPPLPPESQRKYSGLNLDRGRDPRLYRSTDPRVIRTFGRQQYTGNIEDSRLLRRHPMYQRFQTEQANIEADLNIPGALMLGKQGDILRQADQQLKSGHLTREQHRELLNQLAKLYELQSMKQQQREEEFRERVMSTKDMEPNYPNQRGYGNYVPERTYGRAMHYNHRPPYESKWDKPRSPVLEPSVNRMEIDETTIPAKALVDKIVPPKPNESPLGFADTSEGVKADILNDEVPVAVKPVDSVKITTDGESEKLEVSKSSDSTAHSEGDGKQVETVVPKSADNPEPAGECDSSDPADLTAQSENDVLPEIAKPERRESRFEPVKEETLATPTLSPKTVKRICDKMPDEIAPQKLGLPTQTAVKDAQIPRDMEKRREKEELPSRRNLSPIHHGQRSYDERNRYRDYHGPSEDPEYRLRDPGFSRDKPQDEWKDQWRDDNIYRNDRRNPSEIPIRDEYIPDYWHRRDDDYHRRPLHYRERGGRIGSPQRMMNEYSSYRDAPITREGGYRDYPPPMYRPGPPGHRMRYEGHRPSFDPIRTRYEPARPHFDAPPIRPWLDNRGSAPPGRNVPYYPVNSGEIHRPGFQPPRSQEYYNNRPMYLPQTEAPLGPGPSVEGSVSQSTVAPPALPLPLPLPNLDVSELYQKLVLSGIIPNSTVKVEEKAPEEDVKEKIEPSEEPKEEIENDDDDKIPSIELVTESLRLRHAGVINQLYNGIQCSSCGLRFTSEQTEKYAQHLDWHFRHNRRDRDSAKKAVSRKWYYDVQDWIQFEEVEDLEERARSLFEVQALEDQTDQDEILITVPVGENEEDNCCAECREPFAQFWDEEREGWHLRDALRVDNKTYHPLCYEDIKNAAIRESTAAAAAEANAKKAAAAAAELEAKRAAELDVKKEATTEIAKDDSSLGESAVDPESMIDPSQIKTEIDDEKKDEIIEAEATATTSEISNLEPFSLLCSKIKIEPVDDSLEIKTESKIDDELEGRLLLSDSDSERLSPFPGEAASSVSVTLDPTEEDKDDENNLVIVTEEPMEEEQVIIDIGDEVGVRGEIEVDKLAVENESDYVIESKCDNVDNVSHDDSAPPIKMEIDNVVKDEQSTKDDVNDSVSPFVILPPVERGTELSGLCTIL